jgi:formate dehydrogenase gamma subunit
MKHSGAKIEQIVKIIYIWLIVLTVGLMVIHNFIIWGRAVRKKIAKEKTQKSIVRMTGFEKGNHLLITISFTILVITGFALKYPDAFWVKFLFSLGMTEAIRGFVHRVAAVFLILDSLLFLIYIIFRPRGKRVLKELMPKKRDFSDLMNTVKYYLGIRKDKIRYGVFNYAEKFEFWALVWGTVIMVVTGVILWFPKMITSGLPSWIIGVSRVIHFYEALLATLAILIFHIFYTMFKPGEYPMNTSWLTGNILEEGAQDHFDDEAIEIMKRGLSSSED